MGKSTLLNTVAGRAVSETSVRRPCTRAPIVFYHEDYQEAFASPSFLPGYRKGETGGDGSEKEIILSDHDDDALHDVILVDSPDFDSVSDLNRELSEDILRIADLVVYVVNPEKYADDEVWRIIRRITRERRRIIFVFNRGEGDDDEAVVHFGELLRPVMVSAEIITFPDEREASRLGWIPDPEGAGRIREIIAEMIAGGSEGRLRGEALRDSWNEVRTGLEKTVLPALREDADFTRRLQGSLEKEWGEADRRIQDEVALEQASDRKRASEIVRQNLFDIVGVLEQKIFGPVRMFLGRVTGALKERLGQTEDGLRQSVEACHEGNKAAILRHLRDGADRVRTFLEGSDRGRVVASSEAFEATLLDAEAIGRIYDEKRAAYEAWLRDEFQSLTKHVKTTRSFHLAVLQILYIGLMFGAMVHTGGAITLAEGLLAGPLIMLLDRLFLRAIDWEVVEALHKKAQKRFREIFPEIVDAQIERGRELCESLREGGAATAALGQNLDHSDSQLGRLVAALMMEEE